jgi:4-diphosphocytidyl-2-C-methyl-D-erythritol kinase
MGASLSCLGNDLEVAGLAVQPIVGEVLRVLRALPRCRLARMSGSGATCFGLFATAAEAAAAASAIGRDGWWVWGGELRSDRRG